VENVHSRNVTESFKKFPVPDPDADDYKNLIGSFLSTDTSLLKLS